MIQEFPIIEYDGETNSPQNDQDADPPLKFIKMPDGRMTEVVR